MSKYIFLSTPKNTVCTRNYAIVMLHMKLFVISTRLLFHTSVNTQEIDTVKMAHLNSSEKKLKKTTFLKKLLFLFKRHVVLFAHA